MADREGVDMQQASRRRYGTGSIYYRASENLWVGDVFVGYVNGRRKRRRVTSRSREVVEAKVAALTALPEELRDTPSRHLSHRTRNEELEAADARATHTPEQWLAKRDAVRCCVYCGVRGPLVADHATPVSRGGSNGIGNIVPCCVSCNVVKGNRTAAEFIRDRALGVS